MDTREDEKCKESLPVAGYMVDQALLTNRVVSWLGCSDEEILELQQLLNNGSTRTAMLPGVPVIDDYFSIEEDLHGSAAGSHTSSGKIAGEASCATYTATSAASPKLSPVSTGFHLQGDISPGAGVEPLMSPLSPRDGEDSTVAEDVNFASLWESIACATEAFTPLLHGLAGVCTERQRGEVPKADLDESAMQPSHAGVLEIMCHEVHLDNCNGCGQRIIGRRLKCLDCSNFNLCEACTARPMHWPGAPLTEHRSAHPSHIFAQVSLPDLHCPRGHVVSPGWIPNSPRLECQSCDGPLHNGILPAGQGPQFCCKSIQTYCFALCVSCYWANRRTGGEATSESIQDVSGFESAIVKDLASTTCFADSRRRSESVQEASALNTNAELISTSRKNNFQCRNHHSDSSGFVDCGGARTKECEEEHVELYDHLHCNVFFSSPLCVGHVLRIQGDGETSASELGIVNSETEVGSWGVKFHSNSPSIVRDVLLVGRVAAWNEQQDEPQNLVRPGDTLVKVSVAGIALMLQGRPPVLAIRELFNRLRSHPHHVCGQRVSVDLFFSGMRTLPRLRIADEISALQDTGCKVISRAATTENIRALIATGHCRILHFSFHTSSDQSKHVFLEDMRGKAHVLSSNDFTGLLTQISLTQSDEQTVRLVFINSCHSLSLGRDIVDAGVRHVVCVRDEHSVLDTSCQCFSKHFYTALNSGQSIKQSFDHSVKTLQISPMERVRDDAVKFVLLPEGKDHSEVLAPRRPSSASTASKRGCAKRLPEGGTWGLLPARVEDFVGREVDVYRLLVMIRGGGRERRFVLIQGEIGIGKTALMAEVGRFVALREHLFNEVRWVTIPVTRHEEALLEYEQGLNELRGRCLSVGSSHRVLLMVDNPALVFWGPVRQLLTLPNMYFILTVTPSALPLAALQNEAIVAGAKPVCFHVEPLDLLAQGQLFMNHRSRQLYTSEVFTGSSPKDQAWLPRKPADIVALASSPIMRKCGGNSRRIVEVAHQLMPLRLPNSVNRAAEGDISGGSPQFCNARSYRKMRLQLPDGGEMWEWLPPCAVVYDILNNWSPKASRGQLDVFIDGYRAQLDMSIAQFGNSALGKDFLDVKLCERRTSCDGRLQHILV